MKYPEPLAHLISYIPADVYADKEKEITEIADGIAKDRARLKEAVLKSWDITDEYGFFTVGCAHCPTYGITPDHHPDCIVRQLQEERE